jgi:hypothetical protein
MKLNMFRNQSLFLRWLICHKWCLYISNFFKTIFSILCFENLNIEIFWSNHQSNNLDNIRLFISNHSRRYWNNKSIWIAAMSKTNFDQSWWKTRYDFKTFVKCGNRWFLRNQLYVATFIFKLSMRKWLTLMKYNHLRKQFSLNWFVIKFKLLINHHMW